MQWSKHPGTRGASAGSTQVAESEGWDVLTHQGWDVESDFSEYFRPLPESQEAMSPAGTILG